MASTGGPACAIGHSGCAPCTAPVASTARTVDEIIEELRTGKFKHVAEQAGRAQDTAEAGLETLRRDGYM